MFRLARLHAYIYIHTHIYIHIQTGSPFNQTKRRGVHISVRRCEVLALFGMVVPTRRTKRVIRLSELALVVVLSNCGFISGCGGFMYITGVKVSAAFRGGKCAPRLD